MFASFPGVSQTDPADAPLPTAFRESAHFIDSPNTDIDSLT